MPENAVMSQPTSPISQIVMRKDARNNNGGLLSGVCARDSSFAIKMEFFLHGCARLFQCVPSPLSGASCARPCNLCLCSVLPLRYVITLPTAGQAWILQRSLFFMLNTRTQKRRAFSFWWPKSTHTQKCRLVSFVCLFFRSFFSPIPVSLLPPRRHCLTVTTERLRDAWRQTFPSAYSKTTRRQERGSHRHEATRTVHIQRRETAYKSNTYAVHK